MFLIYKKLFSSFLSNWFGIKILQQLPLQGRFIVLDIYLDALCVSISTTIHLPFGG